MAEERIWAMTDAKLQAMAEAISSGLSAAIETMSRALMAEFPEENSAMASNGPTEAEVAARWDAEDPLDKPTAQQQRELREWAFIAPIIPYPQDGKMVLKMLKSRAPADEPLVKVSTITVQMHIKEAPTVAPIGIIDSQLTVRLPK